MLWAGLTFAAPPQPYIQSRYDHNSGGSFVRIVNPTNVMIDCEIVGINYYVFFHIAPFNASRWYIYPEAFRWRCYF